MFSGFVYLPGNGYRENTCKKFLNTLKEYFGLPVIFIQLLENKSKSIGYRSLEPKPYSDYIDKHIPEGKWILMGISMGCLHIANYAHFYPNKCADVMFMFEPTIMQGYYPLLHQYEEGRGNGEWLEDLRVKPNNLDIPANEKVMDIAVSPPYGLKPLRFPYNINIGVVYTTRSNTNEKYTPGQLNAKNKYYHILKKQHKKCFMLKLNTSHCIDTQPQYFNTLINFISKVIKVSL